LNLVEFLAEASAWARMCSMNPKLRVARRS
jgi:hypothetical protein